MASQPPKSGITVVFARAVAKPGKGDELENLLQHAVASANSDKEPFTLDYRCARHGDEFRLFERYNQDIGGIDAHKSQPAFQNLVKSGLVADIEIKFYNEIPKL
ncbi:hypothetical protein NBRC10512_002288 [Rhodotorula toruloides]|uniref:RHTO0S08e06458g1_1 n=2 Tax=Rhodotorula toruloides TaxID=5286 RepID=A0A061B1X1_RHOTO|nr:antibiotic biosynthesis monooxygenase [Rhodotorula toruloides NP11]EMS22220.1 antibiotic biosynthesis monooxygenase [Rhodotorula toruloides NP11]KAJ8294724.1 hypothetical protein OF846_002534 [Rhodotorula toruloides]CDR43826.1 RHTO0S08e06458g1_1 [Rhodotorula toruloides]